MAQAQKLRPRDLSPQVDDIDTQGFYDWVRTSLNQLIGQQVPPAAGFGTVQGNIDPTGAIITSSGSRISSLTTGFSASAPSTTSIQLWWDGTNSSTILRIYRDDGTVAGPFPGNQLVTGLSPSTTYFFYPYFDEATQSVKFVSQAGAVGSPPIAYASNLIQNAISQMLRGRIPLGSNLATTGFATPGAGSTSAAGVGGGGGGGGGHFGTHLL